nr:hypothetical protein [Mesorhizobium sp.]
MQTDTNCGISAAGLSRMTFAPIKQMASRSTGYAPTAIKRDSGRSCNFVIEIAARIIASAIVAILNFRLATFGNWTDRIAQRMIGRLSTDSLIALARGRFHPCDYPARRRLADGVVKHWILLQLVAGPLIWRLFGDPLLRMHYLPGSIVTHVPSGWHLFLVALSCSIATTLIPNRSPLRRQPAASEVVFSHANVWEQIITLSPARIVAPGEKLLPFNQQLG